MHSRSLAPILLALAGLALAEPGLAQSSPCPPQGLLLGIEGGRLGDPIDVQLAGTPLTIGVLGADLGGGPTATSWGPVCLDLSPAAALLPIALDSLGTASYGLHVTPDPSLQGVRYFFQAVVLDPFQPTLLAFSNGDEIEWNPPRLFALDPGIGPGAGTPGNLLIFNALDRSVETTVALSARVNDIAWLPGLDRALVLLFTRQLESFDGRTGALVATTTVPDTPPRPSRLVSVEEPNLVAVLHRGEESGLSGGTFTPGGISIVDVETGLMTTTPFVSASPQFMIHRPGTTLLYIVDETDLILFDYSIGAEITQFAMGTGRGDIVDMILHEGVIYTLNEGNSSPTGGLILKAGMNALDLAVGPFGWPRFPSPLEIPIGTSKPSMLRMGPGLVPNTLYVVFPDFAEIAMIDPTTLLTLASQIHAPDTVGMELSDGGTQWLLLATGGPTTPGRISVLDPTTLLVTPVADLPSEKQFGPIVFPSAFLDRAFVFSGATQVLGFDTDPLLGTFQQTPIPIPRVSKVLTD